MPFEKNLQLASHPSAEFAITPHAYPYKVASHIEGKYEVTLHLDHVLIDANLFWH